MAPGPPSRPPPARREEGTPANGRTRGMSTRLRSIVPIVAGFVLCSAGCAAEQEVEIAAADSQEGALTGASLSPLLADVLSGGTFRCSEKGADYRNRGDVVVAVAPAARAGSSWRSSVTLAGSYST